MADPSWLARLVVFLGAVLSHWIESLAGIVLVIEPFLESHLPKGWREWLEQRANKETRRRVVLTLSALFFLYAAFQAFDDVNRRLRVAERELAEVRGQITVLTSENPGVLEAKRFYIEQHTDRSLKEEEKKLLKPCLEQQKERIGLVAVGSDSLAESIQYANDFLSFLNEIGMNVPPDYKGFPIDIRWPSTSDRGVYVSVKDRNGPPPQAVALMNCLETAHIRARYSSYAGKSVPSPVLLTIAPR